MAPKGVPLTIPGGGVGADIVSGRSPTSRPAPGLTSSGSAGAGVLDADRAGRPTRGSSASSRSGTAAGGSRAAISSAPQAAQTSGDRSSASGSSRGAGADTSTDSAGNSRSAKAGKSSADTGSGKQSAGSATQGRGASGASSAGAAHTAAQGSAQAAAGANDFAAALAQSLAATPADGAATTDAAATQSQGAGAGASGESHAKHSAADPVSSALALLEQALAGGLVAAQSNPPVTSTPGTSTSGASSPTGGTIDTAGKSGTAALTTLLAQNLPTDTRADASNPASVSGSATSAASAATAATASTAAALAAAAAQLSSGSQIASQQGPDSSRLALASPMGTNAWTDELGTKLTWMAHQGIESASLQLSPEHLGPLHVSISVHDGQASVWFGAAQPDTRTALQQSLPQLRQLFVSQGLTLADAGVSREPPRGQSRQNSARSTAAISAAAAVNPESSGTRATIIGGLGLLDTYV